MKQVKNPHSGVVLDAHPPGRGTIAPLSVVGSTL